LVFSPLLSEAHVEHKFLRDNSLSPRVRLAWFLLESYAGLRPYCYPGVDRLAHDLGVERRTMFEVLAEGEEAGLWLRVFEPGYRSKLLGFVLLRRTNPALSDVTAEQARRDLAPRLKAELIARKTAQSPRGKPRNGWVLPHSR
jgi:hypothetical protein